MSEQIHWNFSRIGVVEGNRRKILFNNIPGARRTAEKMPDGYEGFNWENLFYVEESHAQSHLGSAWKNIFKYGRYGIYHPRGSRLTSIRSAKGKKLFSLISIDATLVDRCAVQWQITAFGDNLKIYSKTVTFSEPGKDQQIPLNWKSIDEVTFSFLSGWSEVFIGMIEIED